MHAVLDHEAAQLGNRGSIETKRHNGSPSPLLEVVQLTQLGPRVRCTLLEL